MQQAARVSDSTAFFYMGELIEYGDTDADLHQPRREAHRGLRHRPVRLTMATHTDRAFERELNELRERLLAMGALVEAMIAECVRSLIERDSKLAEHVIEGDEAVNRLEVEIDDLCLQLLALRQPAASDLRFITTALKIVTDLERVGDLGGEHRGARGRPEQVRRHAHLRRPAPAGASSPRTSCRRRSRPS